MVKLLVATSLALGVVSEDQTHYGKPPCLSDEIEGQLQGGGALCAAPCDDAGGCPTDVDPSCTNPKPQCILQEQTSGKKYCGLTCGVTGGNCPDGATCSSKLAGVCTYPNGTIANSGSTFVKKYARGYKRTFSNADDIAVAEITDEMRAAAPAKLDWSTTGAVTPVKDQGQCGSCWAYSATEGIESGVYMATKNTVELAEQQIISCDKTDLGCNGGDLPSAFQYVEKNGGIDTESDYPDTSSRTGRDGSCKKSAKKKVKVTGFKYAVPPCTRGACKNQKESDMMAALNTYGPLSVCVNANDWDGYNSGIYSKRCSGASSQLDHCVQLVGYDTTGSKSYWKVRNSWNTDWGENGFIRLPMGENACGIADEAMYVEATTESEEVTV